MSMPPRGRPVSLKTKRFELRSLMPADPLDRWLDWVQDPEVMGPLNNPVRAWPAHQLKAHVASADNHQKYLVGIFDLANQVQIGCFMIDVAPFHRRAIFNVVIGDKSWWGKGVTNETRGALLDEFFDNRGIEKAVGTPLARNFPAVFNYKAQGWHHEGTLRGHWTSTSGGPRLDQYQFGLTKDEWQNMKRRQPR
jgi:[ribosomal protein S5]-alanine N-acetyltransferase